MTPKDIDKIKVEVAQDILKNYISKVITTQERVMFLKQLVEEANKKKEKDRSEQEKKLVKEHKANLAVFTGSIDESEIHIRNFVSLIESYTKDESAKS